MTGIDRMKRRTYVELISTYANEMESVWECRRLGALLTFAHDVAAKKQSPRMSGMDQTR